jgi:hypothetical protein
MDLRRENRGRSFATRRKFKWQGMSTGPNRKPRSPKGEAGLPPWRAKAKVQTSNRKWAGVLLGWRDGRRVAVAVSDPDASGSEC